MGGLLGSFFDRKSVKKRIQQKMMKRGGVTKFGTAPGGGPGRGRGWVYIGKREWGLKTPRPICDGLADIYIYV